MKTGCNNLIFTTRENLKKTQKFVRISLLLAILVFSLFGTAYADIYSITTQEIIQNDEKTNNFVDLIIDTIKSIFNLVYNLEDNPKLEQWASQVIQDRAQRAEDKINSQLGITQDTSKITVESDKILNSVKELRILSD